MRRFVATASKKRPGVRYVQHTDDGARQPVLRNTVSHAYSLLTIVMGETSGLSPRLSETREHRRRGLNIEGTKPLFPLLESRLRDGTEATEANMTPVICTCGTHPLCRTGTDRDGLEQLVQRIFGTGFRTTAWQRDASEETLPSDWSAVRRAKTHRNPARDPKDWREKDKSMEPTSTKLL
ncbi:hypothetical protein FQN60_016585 [Etheostoma spectabile]|uniref:Uncharacterized protein n=1 Tax=Etheostoma spectabile TaxID=54343 RepID=A0A5J5D3S1_9PERO|nr:hypothetical protein FQN60_016585 [Etheostoma spectabile]